VSFLLRFLGETRYFYADMTKDQALQLGEALIAWSHGADLEARDVLNTTKDWYPFFPDSYEKITVEEGIEWRTAAHSTTSIGHFGSTARNALP
jgi:hypothetical protein